MTGVGTREGDRTNPPDTKPPHVLAVFAAREGGGAYGHGGLTARVGGGPPFFEGMAMLIVINLTGDPGHPLSRVQNI